MEAFYDLKNKLPKLGKRIHVHDEHDHGPKNPTHTIDKIEHMKEIQDLPR
jgi:hypothetical protein